MYCLKYSQIATEIPSLHSRLPQPYWVVTTFTRNGLEEELRRRSTATFDNGMRMTPVCETVLVRQNAEACPEAGGPSETAGGPRELRMGSFCRYSTVQTRLFILQVVPQTGWYPVLPNVVEGKPTSLLYTRVRPSSLNDFQQQWSQHVTDSTLR